MPPESLPAGRVEERIEAGRARQIVDARLPLRLPLAEQPADEVHIFEHAERGVEIAAEALRHIGDARVGALPERLVLEVSIERPHLAGLDLAHAGDEPEQGRFADAVRADESGHPARGNGDRHVIERDGLAVAMRDAFERGGDGGCDLLRPFRFDERSHRRGSLFAGLIVMGGSLTASLSGQFAEGSILT